jgi:antitoxin component YwqK of YwqJK toxin-antitoxin module
MKQKLAFLLLIMLLSSNSFGQKLTLTDLTILCNKKNWEDVNQFMLLRGWTYYNSEEGNTEKYSTITWSYNKDDYSDKAQGWFYLYTFDNYPNKISYSIFNKTSYLLIQNSLVANGFKLIDSEIEDEKVISTYANAGYTLKISNSKREDEDWSDRSVTAYGITLIKKAGIYDSQNGKKTEYYDNDVIKAEYSLLNGKINGPLKIYDEYGNLQKITNYVNGIVSGKVVEYKENGEKNAEYSMSNDSKNGLLTFYENNKISFTTNYKNDLKNGQHINYYYNDETQMLFLKEYGQYLNEEKNGTWKTFYVDGKNEKLLTYTNYLKDLKEGMFQEIQGDSLIIGNYKADELHGNYKIYIDQSRLLLGGLINTDTSKLRLITDGQYIEGSKTGYWKIYDITGTLRSEGNYFNNLENGVWKYYYPNWVKKDGKPEKYAKELILNQNYSNGKLNGKTTRFSYRDEEKYPCNELDEKGVKLDTCTKFVYNKVLETSYYKDDELNGDFELRDSINQVIAKGNYLNGLKDGVWLHRYTETDAENTPYSVFQKGKYINDKKEGKWIEYYNENKIESEFTFKNDELDGEYIEYNEFSKRRFIKQFERGKLKQLIINDSLGINKIKKYDIVERTENSLKCVETEYLNNLIVSQEYWLKNDDVGHNFFQLDFLIKTSEKSDDTLGYKDGDFTLTTLNSEPLVKGKYYKENKIDLWTDYFYDQNVKIEKKYVDNKSIEEVYLKLDGTLFSGEFEYLDTEKNIKEIRKIKDGLRNGKTSFIDLKTNKTINKETYKDGKLKE